MIWVGRFSNFLCVRKDKAWGQTRGQTRALCDITEAKVSWNVLLAISEKRGKQKTGWT